MTENMAVTYDPCEISTHILAKRMTQLCSTRLSGTGISTHILAKRMTVQAIKEMPALKFQLTSSRRGWHYGHLATGTLKDISTHILAKRMTTVVWVLHTGKRIFQLTSSRRGWRNRKKVDPQEQYFNSHPREEDDGLDDDNLISLCAISTHILAKRMTKAGRYGNGDIRISTHILAKRMTLVSGEAGETGEFQLTSSRRGWRCLLLLFCSPYYFNSHPREEDDSNFKQNLFI